MKGTTMARGARTVVEVCAAVRPGEHVLVVTDPQMTMIADAIATAAYAAGAEPSLLTIVPRSADGQEPPPAASAAMASADVFICPVSTSITHTRAVRDACAAGGRGIMLTQFAPAMLAHGGIEADFGALAPICRAVANALAGAEEITVRTPAGTDLTMSAAGRQGNALTCIVGPGQFSPVPNVEANVSPLEGTANGVIVADASIPYLGIGLLREPVVLHVSDGMITSIEGGEQAEILQQDLAARADPMVYNIAELGIGLNPKCRFIGFMLEDEGVYGSVHIGIGTNITLGGNVKAACHYDLIMRGATVIADGQVVLWDGQLAIEPHG